MTSIEWAQATNEHLGPVKAFMIARYYKAPTFGDLGGEKNKSSEFYRNAYAWMKKRLTQSSLNSLSNMGVHP